MEIVVAKPEKAMENTGINILFPLAASRESANPSNIVESPSYIDNQNTDKWPGR